MLTQLGARAGVGLVVAATIVMIVGIAPPIVLGSQLIVGSARAERAGVASGMGETANALGAALGIVRLGSLATAIYRYDVADQVPSHTAAAVRDTFRERSTPRTACRPAPSSRAWWPRSPSRCATSGGPTPA